MKNGQVLLGVLAGLVVGAILGVLFAPASGAETRQNITGKSNEFAESLKSKFDSFIDSLVEQPSADTEEK